MTMVEQSAKSPILIDWETGFGDGYKARPRQRNRGSMYLTGYRAGQKIALRTQSGGDDTGPLANPSKARRR